MKCALEFGSQRAWGPKELADLHLTYVKEIERVRVCRQRARKRKRFIGETFYVRVTSVVSPIRRLRGQSND